MIDLLASIPSMYIANIVLGIVLAACIGFVGYGRNRDLNVWAWGFSLYSLVFILFGLRDSMPLPFAIVAGNGLWC